MSLTASPKTGRKPIVGVMGGIGSGKSEVARIMGTLGAGVVDSDDMVHEELRCADVVEQLVGVWGDKIVKVSGELDRRAIASIVFDDAAELKRLEDILYPRIEARRRRLVEEFQSDPSIVAIVFDTPKLLEVGLHRECDFVVFVEADDSVRYERVRKTRGWSRAEMKRRENLLAPLERKKAIADHIFVNNSERHCLDADVERWFQKVIASCPY